MEAHERANVKVAAVAGASGLVGRQLLARMVSNKTYSKVYALLRREVHVPPQAITLHVDYEQLDVVQLPQLDEAFCCLGTTRRKAGSKAAFRQVDFQYVWNFARWARQQGCHRFFLITAVGAHKQSCFFYNRVKGEIEEAVASLGFDTLVIARPSLLIGRRSEPRVGEQLLAQLLAPIASLLPAGYRPIRACAVAAALLHAAQTFEGGRFILRNEDLLKLSE